MNLIIIICSIAVTLYVIAESYTLISGWIAEWQLEKELKEEEKKRANNELYQFKLKQLYFFNKAYYIECGYSPKKADYLAVNALNEMDKDGLIDEKYSLIRSYKNGNVRNQRSCK